MINIIMKANQGMNLRKLGERDKKGTISGREKLSRIYLNLMRKK